ncbi:1-acyl-sn-glycerol-3-phosphate acyltransferase [Aliidongia dinghuensis]|uniref:1-acyl-sn-glycerol-3-phosphate acyltransferase n=1 Tax=Aliidongia dinghuensis TaxID=1867774 RepID=A0A8J3E1G5_9PROT|nr:lysophospholipid acyltransferase family protein [Aliidongia dinghuensis]GGE99704.1 1-acyl-sn-glycerol-3-phosphate acyltransferase [Aliidongia dinghuensis]
MTQFATNGLSFMRLSAYLAVTATALPVQVLALVFGWQRVSRDLPRLYHGLVCRILGFRIRVKGSLSSARPTLFVSNHASYIDIEVLGALITGSFVAKSEVKTWPVFGVLAQLQRTVFVDRRVRSSAEQRDSLAGRLQAGDNLILFPEGTSNDGNRLKPFKSALFSAAEIRIDGHALAVQPVTIAYVRLNGAPIGRHMRPYFAWYGDMALADHLWHLAGLGLAEVLVEFHEPVTVEALGSRKRLAEHCERVIAAALADANSGRHDDVIVADASAVAA